MELIRMNRQEAHDFYRKYEHLGNAGLGVWHYGLCYDGKLISVVSYGTTSFNSNRGFLANISKRQNVKVIQLCRGGTRRDIRDNIPSQIIKYSLKEIYRQHGNSLVIAYSDVEWNEIGTIYQASNFIYTGLTDPKGQSNYIIDGKLVSGWNVRKRYNTRCMSKLKKMGLDVTRVPLNKKHRYIFINASRVKGKFLRKELEPFEKDFPSRKKENVSSMLELDDSVGMAKRLRLTPCSS